MCKSRILVRYRFRNKGCTSTDQSDAQPPWNVVRSLLFDRLPQHPNPKTGSPGEPGHMEESKGLQEDTQGRSILTTLELSDADSTR